MESPHHSRPTPCPLLGPHLKFQGSGLPLQLLICLAEASAGQLKAKHWPWQIPLIALVRKITGKGHPWAPRQFRDGLGTHGTKPWLCCSLPLCQSSTVAVGSSSLSPQCGVLQAGMAQPIVPDSCWYLSHSAGNGINLDNLGKPQAGDICSIISPLSLISIPACPQCFCSHWRPSSHSSEGPLPSPINRHCCQNILSQSRAILPPCVSAQP